MPKANKKLLKKKKGSKSSTAMLSNIGVTNHMSLFKLKYNFGSSITLATFSSFFSPSLPPSLLFLLKKETHGFPALSFLSAGIT
jgi:TRAP-type C4-dicarboxylate transport system permease large subunit